MLQGPDRNSRVRSQGGLVSSSHRPTVGNGTAPPSAPSQTTFPSKQNFSFNFLSISGIKLRLTQRHRTLLASVKACGFGPGLSLGSQAWDLGMTGGCLHWKAALSFCVGTPKPGPPASGPPPYLSVASPSPVAGALKGGGELESNLGTEQPRSCRSWGRGQGPAVPPQPGVV